MQIPKHIGIVAVTAEGASLCYRAIVSESAKILGQNKHPEISLHNYSFDEIAFIQSKKDWEGLSVLLASSVAKLAATGADFAIIPANSSHYAIELIREKSSIPVLSIVEITVEEARRRQFKKFAILGIGMTMTDGLYEKPLRDLGIEPVIPTKEQQEIVNKIIFENIIPGKTTSESTKKVVEVIQQLKDQGCDSTGMCCTELPIIITERNSPLPFIDTTRLLAQKAVEYSLIR